MSAFGGGIKTLHYILKDGRVREATITEWALWFETAERTISYTDISDQNEYPVGGESVSTVFMGLDHNFRGGPPLIFESMIFGGQFDTFQWRYATLEEAQIGHELILRALRLGQEPNAELRRRATEQFFDMYTGDDPAEGGPS